ncbi:MAG: M28 family peptidase [Deltaproteobacteria bacterium]|nr:M28 family peptidase [Deltaproteobacteria bacterium]
MPTRLALLSVVLLSAAGCRGEENLADAVTAAAMMDHLQALQDIADDNDGNRAAFTDGYAASADYVTEQLELAGYEVHTQSFTVAMSELEDSSLSQVEPLAVDYPFEGEADLGYAIFGGSPSVDLTAEVVPVDVMIPPGTDPNTSNSGCEASDFEDFPSGAIALVQRVLIFNEGQEGRTEWIWTSMPLYDPPDIAAVGLTYGLGAELVALAEAGTVRVHLMTDVTWSDVTDVNVWAETERGDEDNVVHLDSVLAGPGINDNGSGSALVLETAIQFAELQLRPVNKVRFAWWSAEEVGLVGSWFYVQELVADEIVYLNYDMVGSPNGLPLVYASGSLEDDPYDPGPEELVIRDLYDQWMSDNGLPYGEIPGAISSDVRWFLDDEIPSGGLFTGATTVKSEYEASIFGGTAGEAYDPCYHLDCDTVDNIDTVLLGDMGAASAYALQELAMREAPLSQGP